jgi:hypothetical protein
MTPDMQAPCFQADAKLLALQGLKLMLLNAEART